jgi:hypothetical protein
MYKFYTRDYIGETVADVTHWRQGNKKTAGTWIEKSIINDDHNGIAHVVGNGISRLKLNLEFLHGQSGGEGGPHSVGQSYGCNMLFKDFNPTFLICVNQDIINKIAETDYCENNIVYTTRKNIIKHPGKFHLYPNWQILNAGPAALRLACADGHKKIYMIGMDFYFPGIKQNVYPQDGNLYKPIENHNYANVNLLKQLCEIFQLYDDVEFYHVQDGHDPVHLFDEFNWFRNVKSIGFRQYISIAQLGAIAR